MKQWYVWLRSGVCVICLLTDRVTLGRIDGDSAAAMRYTEARFRKLAEEVLVDLEKTL